MNEKRCKEMRAHARLFVEDYPGVPVEAVYKAIKKGARNAAKLARFKATTHQPVQRPTAILEKDHDIDNR